MFYVYILLCRGGSLYTGISNDPEQRFLEHQKGKGGKYTWSHKPIKILYTEKLPGKAKPDDTVKIYIWNPNKNSLYLDDIKISSYKDMNYNY